MIKTKITFDRNKLENSIKEQAKEAISKRTFDVNCPHCNREISIPAGKSTCPLCGKEVNLNLNFKF